MVIVDTSVWIDFFRGSRNAHTELFVEQVRRQRLGLTDLILCEILQGIQKDAEFLEVRRELAKFEILRTGGEELAIASAQNYRVLRTSGHTVRKTVDSRIATFCLMEGHTLLHNDRDFDPFEQHLGLVVLHPENA